MIEPGEYDLDNPIFHRGLAYGKALERESIITLLKEEFGDDYYESGVCGTIVRLIKGHSQ
jgi:hypothetical protein